MAKLSSETLFHYVDKKDYLIDILKNNFRPRYVNETYDFQSSDLKKVAVPMLCFCDITLSNIEEHVEWYGRYGIGMNKEWAIRNGITPVHYYSSESYMQTQLVFALEKLKRTLSQNSSDSSELLEAYISMNYKLWFMKPYKGIQYHKKDRIEKSKNFYDEREWRYIPSIEELKSTEENVPMSITGNILEEYNQNVQFKNMMNSKLRNNIMLEFHPDDIAYIIVESENERKEMIEAIREAKFSYLVETKELLYSKIISYEQIRRDF